MGGRGEAGRTRTGKIRRITRAISSFWLLYVSVNMQQLNLDSSETQQTQRNDVFNACLTDNMLLKYFPCNKLVQQGPDCKRKYFTFFSES